jgi:L-rhamnose mutarotase
MREKNIITLTQSKIYVFVTRRLGKISFCSLLLMSIAAIVNQSDFGYIKRFSHIAIIFILVGLIVDRFFRKIACKIVIDFDACIIEYYMRRSSEIKKYGFHTIKDIKIKNYLIFILENEKILYNLAQDEGYIRSIEKLKILSEKCKEIRGKARS